MHLTLLSLATLLSLGCLGSLFIGITIAYELSPRPGRSAVIGFVTAGYLLTLLVMYHALLLWGYMRFLVLGGIQ